MRFVARVPPYEYEIEAKGFPENDDIAVNGKPKQARLIRLNHPASFLLLIDNHSHQIIIEDNDKHYFVRLNNRTFQVKLENERACLIRHLIKTDDPTNRQQKIKAPMPGMIVKVSVQEGQQIKKGDGLVIIEAMKMENEIRAASDGRVKKIFKTEKESVEKDMILILME